MGGIPTINQHDEHDIASSHRDMPQSQDKSRRSGGSFSGHCQRQWSHHYPGEDPWIWSIFLGAMGGQGMDKPKKTLDKATIAISTPGVLPAIFRSIKSPSAPKKKQRCRLCNRGPLRMDELRYATSLKMEVSLRLTRQDRVLGNRNRVMGGSYQMLGGLFSRASFEGIPSGKLT